MEVHQSPKAATSVDAVKEYLLVLPVDAETELASSVYTEMQDHTLHCVPCNESRYKHQLRAVQTTLSETVTSINAVCNFGV